jgi:hypothetical protein
MAYLDACCAALRRGWSADNVRGAAAAADDLGPQACHHGQRRRADRALRQGRGLQPCPGPALAHRPGGGMRAPGRSQALIPERAARRVVQRAAIWPATCMTVTTKPMPHGIVEHLMHKALA